MVRISGALCSTTRILSSFRDYFIATGAIYLTSLLYSQFKTSFLHGVHTATIDRVPGGFIRINIPTHITWKPGQHIFIRFLTLGIHSLTAHPFTICSLPHESERCGKYSEITLYVKPQGGVTARLAKLAEAGLTSTARVLIEGPYGGLGAGSLGRFDTSLVISGGSGAGFSLAVAEDAMRQHRYIARLHDTQTNDDTEAGQNLRPKLHIVYSTRHAAAAEWYENMVKDLVSSYSHWTDISASVHITVSKTDFPEEPSSPDSPTRDDIDPEKAPFDPAVSALGSANNTVIYPERGRPNIQAIISSFAAAGGDAVTRTSRSIGIAACGPVSLLHDARNAAADAQSAVLAGKNDLTEVYLHSELFW